MSQSSCKHYIAAILTAALYGEELERRTQLARFVSLPRRADLGLGLADCAALMIMPRTVSISRPGCSGRRPMHALGPPPPPPPLPPPPVAMWRAPLPPLPRSGDPPLGTCCARGVFEGSRWASHNMLVTDWMITDPLQARHPHRRESFLGARDWREGLSLTRHLRYHSVNKICELFAVKSTALE